MSGSLLTRGTRIAGGQWELWGSLGYGAKRCLRTMGPTDNGEGKGWARAIRKMRCTMRQRKHGMVKFRQVRAGTVSRRHTKAARWAISDRQRVWRRHATHDPVDSDAPFPQ